MKTPTPKPKPEIMWAITGVYGLYVGTWFWRKDAIACHTRDIADTWENCLKRGDRAIKVKVAPL